MAPPSEFAQLPSAVVGGIASLTLTLVLLKQRIPVTFYEVAPQFGRGWRQRIL